MHFIYSEDKKFFQKLLQAENKVEFSSFTDLFDGRPPALKRAEFARLRKEIFKELERLHGKRCLLNYEICDPGSGFAIDHLIPLSSNKLNKELRNLTAVAGKKVASQSFGSNNLSNLVIACNKCNNHKKHRFLDSGKLKQILELKRRVEKKD